MRALTLRLDAAHLTGTLLDGDSRALASRIESLEKLDGSDPAEGALLALLARYKLSTGATASEAVGVVKRAIANPRTLIDEGPDSLWLLNSVVILVQAECLDDAEQLLARAVEQARTLGSATGYALASIHRARIALRRGALRDAEAEARTALDALLEHSWYATSATGMLMDALIQQGRLDEAQVAYDGLGLGEQIPDMRPATPILIVRGLLREQQGHLERAASDLTDALARIARFNVRNAVGLDARIRLIYINRALGAHATARAAAQEVHEIAAAWGAPGRSAKRFVPRPRSPRTASGRSRCCAKRSCSWAARPRDSSTRARSPISGPPCVAADSAANHGRRCEKRSRSPSGPAPRDSPSARVRSSRRAGCGSAAGARIAIG